MPVRIHGNEYVTVAERVALLHKARKTEVVSIDTFILSEDDTQIVVKAIVKCAAGTFTGHAHSMKKAGGPEGDAPLEVAETSAVGRALGFAGYGIIEGVASADEVIVAQAKTPRASAAQGAAPVLATPWKCKDCGGTNLGDDFVCLNCGRERGAK